ncbi:hypothetical protein RclHR1_00520032 [Rhizophagus clarus]|uniref:Uncharacterized protein n=1 Tax=Rhizophagus clarus TaxID=94130 RepID=A0A2Z6S3B5_9GLOM|nr:hypothetical protein RclHR1_00520032 [Rhizophagus clarus]
MLYMYQGEIHLKASANQRFIRRTSSLKMINPRYEDVCVLGFFIYTDLKYKYVEWTCLSPRFIERFLLAFFGYQLVGTNHELI